MRGQSFEIFTKMTMMEINDIDDLRQVLWKSDLEAIPLANDRPKGFITRHHIGDATLTLGRIEGALRVTGAMPPNVTTIGVLLSQDGESTHWGHETQGGTLCILPENSVKDAVYRTKQYEFATMAVAPSSVHTLYEKIAPHLNDVLARPDAFDLHSVGQSQCTSAFTRFADLLAKLAKSGTGLTIRQTESLLNTMLGTIAFALECVTRGPFDKLSNCKRDHQLIVRVEDLVRSPDGYQICSVPELCLALAVERRTLERAFRRVLDLSPAQYLLRMRLCAANKALLSGETTVTEIATQHGFFELGRFTMKYKQAFGELPSETIKSAQSRIN